MTAERIADLIGKASRLADRMAQGAGTGPLPPDRADRVDRLRRVVRTGETVIRHMASNPGAAHPLDRRRTPDRRVALDGPPVLTAA